MIKIYLFIFLIFSVILIGCSPIYTVKDFSTKEKFYDDFNKSVRDQSIKISLLNNNSQIFGEKAIIKNDTLIVSLSRQIKRTINKNDIQNINYFGKDMNHLSANIHLNNGEIIKVKNININSDSSITTDILEIQGKHIPVSELSAVSYTKHWIGLPIGIISGTVVGFFTSALLNGDRNNNSGDSGNGLYIIPIVEVIGGGVFGWIEGFHYTYQFYP